MLFNNLLLALLSILMPIFTYFAFELGYKAGCRDAKKDNAELPRIIPIKKKEKVEVPEEVKRLSIILDNINNYNGTAEGQRRVK